MPNDRVLPPLGRLLQIEGQIAVQLLACLRASRGDGAIGLSLGLRTLISRWRVLTEERFQGEFTDLGARLDRWRRARNRIVLALGARAQTAIVSEEVARLIRQGDELVLAVSGVCERIEAGPPKTTAPVLTPVPVRRPPQTPRQRIATRYVGHVGFWESPVQEVFTNGPVSFTTHPNVGVSVALGDVRHPTVFKPVQHGWMIPRLKVRYPERIRRYADAVGEMWSCELHNRKTPFTRLARVPYGTGTAASAEFDGTLATMLEARLRTAVERVRPLPTLVLEFSYQSEELEVQLTASEGTGWAGTWRQLRPLNRDRPCDSGSVRGRLFRDGGDALFVGEWRQLNATYTCVVALEREREVFA